MEIVLEDGSGALSTGSPAGRTPPHGDGSMYSQANVRVESVLRPPARALPSVIVDTDKVLREADGPEESDFHHKKSASGGKVFAPGCASKPDGESREEPEEHKRSQGFSHLQWRRLFQEIMGADQQRLQISDLHFDKFPTPATFARWKIRFKTEVCTCSQFPTEAMQWIKEVELVDSVDEFRCSSYTRGISMPNFEVLDARTASALNKIIHNSHFKRWISLEEQEAQKEDRFLRGRQIAYLIYEQFRVTGTHDSVENYTDLFTTSLRNDDMQEFDSKWDGILLSLTKIE